MVTDVGVTGEGPYVEVRTVQRGLCVATISSQVSVSCQDDVRGKILDIYCLSGM